MCHLETPKINVLTVRITKIVLLIFKNGGKAVDPHRGKYYQSFLYIREVICSDNNPIKNTTTEVLYNNALI